MPDTSVRAAAEGMPDLIEPYAIQDTFSSGIGYVEELTPNLYRLVLYADQRGYKGERERVIVAKHIVSGETLNAMAQALFQVERADPAFRESNNVARH